MIIEDSANQIWMNTVGTLLYDNERLDLEVKGALSDTSMASEILNHAVIMDMNYPMVTMVDRHLDTLYAKIEALMMLSGANRLDFHPIIQRTLAKWSDDGIFIRHAYGPKIVDQIPYIIECFGKDPHTRRAVINVWRDSPGPSKDTTCLVSLQFLMRKNHLHCIANMRSSDAWLGMPNDLASYTYVANAIRFLIGEATKRMYALGFLYFNAGSRHLYTHQVEKAQKFFQGSPDTIGDGNMPNCANYDEFVNWLAEQT